jgi:hypothetical protein
LEPNFLAESRNMLRRVHDRAPDQSSNAATPNSDLRAKSHLDDGVVKNFEETGRPARDPVEKRENRSDIGFIDDPASPDPICRAYSVPAVLKRERSQSGAAYCRRRIPSRSSMTLGRQRACQAALASASAFCSSGVRGGAARMTLAPLMLKSVDWLGVSGPAAGGTLPDAGGAAAFAGCEAPAPLLWSVAGCCADAVEIPATAMIKAARIARIFIKPLQGEEKGACRAPRFTIRDIEQQ